LRPQQLDPYGEDLSWVLRECEVRAFPYIAIVVASLIAYSALYAFHILHTHDGTFHTNMALGFVQQLDWSNLYPRWLPENQNHFGSPALYFYSPLLYFVFSFVDIVTGGMISFNSSFAVVLTVFGIIFGLSNLLLFRRLMGGSVALYFAIAALFAPYHLVVDVAIRGALSEVAGIAFTPLMLLSILELSQDPMRSPRPRDLATAALAYAATIYTHLITAMMLVPLLATFAVTCLLQSRAPLREIGRRLFLIAFAFFVGTLLAGPLLVPAVAYIDEITSDWWWTVSQGPWAAMFIRSRWGAFTNSMMNVADPLGIVWLLVLGGSIAAIFTVSDRFARRSSVPFIACAALSLILFSGIPGFLWQRGWPFAVFQFPFRFLHFFEYFSLVVCGIAVSSVLAVRPRLVTPLKGAIGLACAALGVGLWVGLYLSVQRELPERRRQAIETRWQNNEYLPAALTRGRPAEDVRKAIIASPRPLFEAAPPVDRLSATAIVAERSTIEIEADQAFSLRVRQFAFPGWQLTSESGARWAPVVDSTDGTLVFHLSEGTWQLELRRVVTRPEWIGAILAAIGVGVLACMLFVKQHRPALPLASKPPKHRRAGPGKRSAP
jgi:hypothetical protein